ncbi:hypothetical protein, partial [Fulvivirga lutimaris]|uniref:hypothetical protein n=1 Tax=Fulvivirga lutimaris TaxID=1819566 RepID=UPI001623AC94
DRDLGEIPFNYLEIDNWKESLSPLEIQSSMSEVLDLKIGLAKNFNLPINLLHPLISEFRYRHLWHKGADEIIFDEEKINQAGTDHYCIVNDKKLVFETVKPPSGHGQLSYGEVLKNPQPFKYFEADYILTSLGQNKTKLSMFLKASVKWKLQKLFIPIFKIILKKKANQMLGDMEKAIPIYFETLENEVM